MKKKVITFKGTKYYLIGQDKNGENVYLNAASWDCEWYYGFGYITTFTNNRNPELSRDINSHSHFDYQVLKDAKLNGFDKFNQEFTTTVLSRPETWTFIELMKTFYTLRNYSDTLYNGGSHYTNNPCSDIIKNEDEYNRINKIVLPAIFEEIYKLLS